MAETVTGPVANPVDAAGHECSPDTVEWSGEFERMSGDLVNPGHSAAHCATYPVALCEKPIAASCPPDGLVLDPFAGMGTTCVAVKRLGRDYLGIDVNPEYVAVAEQRLADTPTN